MFMALALILGFLSARMFALTVQDRVIRLEERLRYARLLPADLQPRIGEFTVSSARIVALRQRRGAARAGAQSARRKNDGTQSHQAAGEKLET